MWEPGGVRTGHDKWKGLEKCYKHGRLMRVVEQMSSIWCRGIKSKDFDRLATCSFVDIKTWLEVCFCQYKIYMFLLGYYGLEVQVLSCFKEMCVLLAMDTHNIMMETSRVIFVVCIC